MQLYRNKFSKFTAKGNKQFSGLPLHRCNIYHTTLREALGYNKPAFFGFADAEKVFDTDYT
jgi:hypothetical protein